MREPTASSSLVSLFPLESMSIRYTDLIVWQKAIMLVTTVYEVTRQFPNNERYALALQLRKASISIASNIAEGYGRSTRRDTASFLVRARGSVFEVETQLIIANNLKYLATDEFEKLLASVREIGRMLTGLLKYLTRESIGTRH